METLFSGFYRPVCVESTQILAPGLKKVRFTGDFSDSSFVTGQVIEFRVNDTDFRHYTPCFFDKENGICDVLFYLHGKGPGSRWAENLAPGDELKMIGPAGRLKWNSQSRLHLSFGDETSIGLLRAMQEQAIAGDRFEAVLELDREHAHWPGLLGLHAQVAKKNWDHPECEGIRHIWESLYGPEWHEATFYLTGRAKSIQHFRKALLAKGISSKQILSEPYWAEGKAGL